MIMRMLESWAFGFLKRRGWFTERPVPASVDRNLDAAERELRAIRATLATLRAERAVATREYREEPLGGGNERRECGAYR